MLDGAALDAHADAIARDGYTIVADAIDRLAGHIVMAHAKDRDAEGRFVTAGRGVIDFPDFIRRLDIAGFDGPVVTHGLSEQEAPDVRRFLARLIA